MYVYYAKFNINSNLKEIKDENSKKLSELLSELAHQIDVNPHKYQYIYKYEINLNNGVQDEDGNEIKKKLVQEEVYRFVNTRRIKESHGDVILGELVREKPDEIEVYNDTTHEIEKTGIKKRAYRTFFVFDLKSETIGFTERRGMGRNQFIRAFEELSKKILEDQAIKVYLKQDPRSFKEKIQELTKVNEINVEIISPNFVDKELDDIEKEAKKIGKEMDDQNITRMQNHIESSEENKNGIDLNGTFARELLKKYSIMSFLGYAKGKIIGLVGNDVKTIRSEEDAPLVTNIDYDDRNNEMIFKEHVIRNIKQDAVRKAIAKENKLDQNTEG